MKRLSLLILIALLAAACSSDGTDSSDDADSSDDDQAVATTAVTTTTTIEPSVSRDSIGSPIPDAPAFIAMGALADSVAADLDLVFGDLGNVVDAEAITRLGKSGDVRIGWLLADLLRFAQRGFIADTAVAAFEELTGTDITATFAWGQVTDRMIAWDIPAPPGYTDWKRLLFEFLEPGWAPFFDDADADIDWRWLSWGGVLIDDRPIDQTHLPCPDGCIPALNDPAVTDAAGGDWYPDDRTIFGIVVNGEARAYPKNMMEVHEMVNDTVGGRRVGMPYCTLCGSAQAYLTDDAPEGLETLELRTSGLLSRSNKVTYEFHTRSVFDTFTGLGLSGPLQGHQLEPVTVITATWGDWKAAHPDTSIVAEDGGIGRRYIDDPLGGRDDDGPIFPIGEVDPRLPVQEPVLGVVAPDGTAVAFPVGEVVRALEGGTPVEFGDVRVVTDGAGLTAETSAGDPISTHQAFWFAWSQFNPDTAVWSPIGLG